MGIGRKGDREGDREGREGGRCGWVVAFIALAAEGELSVRTRKATQRRHVTTFLRL